MLPKGWDIKPVGDLFEVQLGKMLNKAAKAQEPRYAYLGNSNVKWGAFDLSDLKTMYFSDKEIEKFTLKYGDIIMCEGGEVGRCAIWKDHDSAIYYQKALHRLRVRGEIIPGYFQNYMEKVSGTKLLNDYTTRTSIAHLTREKLVSLPVRLPPLNEQKKIAQILSTWDKAIITTEQLLANSQQQKKALMQQLLAGKNRLLDKNGVRFSGAWKEHQIGSLLKEVKRPVEWNDEIEYRLLSVKRRSEGIVLREVLKGSQILTKKMNTANAGDFLISKMQVVHGASGLVTDEFNGCHISDSYIALVPKSDEKIDIEFFSWFSKQKIMFHKAFLCSYGVHIEKMTFNFKMFLKERILIPKSIEEQRKIAAVLFAANQEITTLQQKIETLKQEKKALMQQLLTGKRRAAVN